MCRLALVSQELERMRWGRWKGNGRINLELAPKSMVLVSKL